MKPVLERLNAHHDVRGFDSGVPALDTWLHQYAGQSARAGMAVTYVAHLGGKVLGYYALTVSEVAHVDAPGELTRRMPRHPIPVIRIARLAVDRAHRGQGLGGQLLREALLSCAHAADIVGARAVVVDAKDDDAMAFYQRYEFEPFPDDPHKLFVTMNDLRDLIGFAG